MRPIPFRMPDPFGLASTAETYGGGLKEQFDFGANPGQLRLFAYRPRKLPRGAPLVVVLHGCRQDARGYDHGAGWSALAERLGFALIAPEQTQANNVRGCFNWFLPEHTRRGAGEPASIRQMIAWALKAYGCDPARIYITGLSAGGAMSAVMLATYPEIFAAGAIIAGLPYGAAGNVQQALTAMQSAPERSAQEWADAVRGASGWKGPWPRVSIWQGDADHTVNPANMEALIAQWTGLHDVVHAHDELGPGLRHRVWRDARGAAAVEAYTIAGLGHGTPIHVMDGKKNGEHPAPFILEAGISSSLLTARFFGLTADGEASGKPRRSAFVGPVMTRIVEQALKAARIFKGR
jgi:feruloyl esterase